MKTFLKKGFKTNLNSVISLANQKARQNQILQYEDLPSLGQKYDSELVFKKFLNYYNSSHSIVISLLKVFGSLNVLWFLFYIVAEILQFALPLLMKEYLKFYKDDSRENYEGYLMALGLLFAALVRNLFLQYGFSVCDYGSTILHSSIFGLLYDKILKLPEKSKVEFGRILNLFAIDTPICSILLLNIYFLLAPFSIIVCFYLLYIEIGWSFLVGLGILIIGLILSKLSVAGYFTIMSAAIKHGDTRMKYINEFLEGIRIIKYYAWENYALKNIKDTRLKEMTYYFRLIILRLLNELFLFWPKLILFGSLCTHAALGNEITLSKLFICLVITKIMQDPLYLLSLTVSYISFARIGLKRIIEFLNTEEIASTQYDPSMLKEGVCISIKNASFSYSSLKSKSQNTEEQEKIVLSGIDLEVKKGQTIGIVGEVGSGKSSIFKALISEMYITQGSINLNGSIAFVPQTPWIINATIRDNILMGAHYDQTKYQTIIEQCQLINDLQILTHGDLTEIGSKGINLSGGQKQRVSLARAVYANLDIYIIDDALSALDAEVGNKILQQIILSTLSEKTVLFATNGIHHLSNFQRIFVLRQGRIIEEGNYSQLINKSDSEFARLAQIEKEQIYQKQNLSSKHKKNENNKINSTQNYQNNQIEKGELIQKEKVKSGSTGIQTYLHAARLAGGFYSCLTLLIFLLVQVLSIFFEWLLGKWGDDSFEKSDQYYETWIGLLIFFLFFFGIIRGIIFGKFHVNLQRKTHFGLITRILRAPLEWFDRTPIGRINNRCNKDQSDVDRELPRLSNYVFRFSLMGLCSLVTIGIITPYFFIVIGIVAFCYAYIFSKIIQLLRDSYRIEALTRSPINSQLSETIDGVSSIRTYGLYSQFKNGMFKLTNSLNEAFFMNRQAVRWLGIRMAYIGSFAIFGACCLTVILREKLSDSLLALIISMTSEICAFTCYFILTIGETEFRMNAVQRILEYSSNIPQEKTILEQFKNKEWPTQGRIKISHLFLRYRPHLPNVLHNICAEITPSEKVGICGRTGSGKSSLTLGLLRILEPWNMAEFPNEGRIMIDNIDIEKIPLELLRCKIGIIPQDPILFHGTLKSNIDPFSKYSDDEILDSINEVHLIDSLLKRKNTNTCETVHTNINFQEVTQLQNLSNEEKQTILNMEVQSRGANYSVGEKQLISMARLIIRNPKIIIMDEATASIDEATDSYIQRMIKSKFKNSTVITIAHRLVTILDYDRIIVLNNGEIIDFDTPKNLMEKKEGIFYQMVESNIH